MAENSNLLCKPSQQIPYGCSMQFQRFAIRDLLLIKSVKRADVRGFFSEIYRSDALSAEGVTAQFVQDNHVYSEKRGVLRGLHFQTPPHAQGKLVRCIRGAVLDVAVDIRKGSPTFGQHVAAELSAANWQQLWVPPGFAHGYVTLEDRCEVVYKVTQYWNPGSERGIAWNDPALAINWGIPASDLTIAEKDRNNPRLADMEPAFRYEGENV
jgi:dTDP-4-dehydrorhamnose 3,5-epimerase